MFNKLIAILRNKEDLKVIESFFQRRGFKGRIDLLVIDFSKIDAGDHVVSFASQTWTNEVSWTRGEIIRIRYDGVSHPSKTIHEVACKNNYDAIIVVSRGFGGLFSMNLASSLVFSPSIPILVIPG